MAHPAKLAGVLWTAIGPASLAGPLAVRSTRAQHLEGRQTVAVQMQDAGRKLAAFDLD